MRTFILLVIFYFLNCTLTPFSVERENSNSKILLCGYYKDSIINTGTIVIGSIYNYVNTYPQKIALKKTNLKYFNVMSDINNSDILFNIFSYKEIKQFGKYYGNFNYIDSICFWSNPLQNAVDQKHIISILGSNIDVDYDNMSIFDTLAKLEYYYVPDKNAKLYYKNIINKPGTIYKIFYLDKDSLTESVICLNNNYFLNDAQINIQDTILNIFGFTTNF